MDDNKGAVIRALAAAGYSLIKLQGKKPYEENWETTPHGRHDVQTIGEGNYGVVLGPKDLVIDVDPRNYASRTDRPLARLLQRIGGPLDTFVVRTGGGGLHIYLRKPVAASVRNSLADYRGVEFKGGPGRQVVGPGSVHPETKKLYTVAQGSPARIAEAPQALLDLINKKDVQFSTEGINEYKDDEATQQRCVGYLKSLRPAVEGQGGDDATFQAACGLRDRGLSPQTAHDLLCRHYNPRCQPPWGEDDLRAKVAHAYLYAQGPVGSAHPAAHFDNVVPEAKESENPAGDREIGKSGWKLDGKKQPVKCFQNLLNYFGLAKVGLRGIFGYNEFSRRVEFLGATPWGLRPRQSPVQDIDLSRMRAHLARNHGYDAGKEDLVDAMVDVAQARRFHPVKEYLSALVWDRKPRLDFWLQTYLGVVDDDYTRAVGRKTLCGAIARIFEPGIKFDHVLVLEGTQGIGKSGVCRILGGEWFSDFRLSVENKDTVQMMQGKWIVEMAELHAVRQTDTDALKAFLTRQIDEARFAYGRLPGVYPRQGIFIATYNPGPDGTYLKDDTGNRRWWPVKCSGVPPGARQFDFKGLAAVRDQLFAEAVARWNGGKGEKLTMETAQLQDAATEAQAQRHAEHPWGERVSAWIEERDKIPETRSVFLTAREVYIGAMQGIDARFGRREALDVAKAMRDIGWVAGFKKSGMNGTAKTLRGYWRPEGEHATVSPFTAIEKEESIFGDLV